MPVELPGALASGMAEPSAAIARACTDYEGKRITGLLAKVINRRHVRVRERCPISESDSSLAADWQLQVVA